MPIVLGTNSYTFSSIDTLTGSGNADAVTLTAGQTNASIDLAAGNDSLTLAAATNSLTLANIETITGDTGAETLTLGSALTNSTTVDLGAGSDKITLAAGGNTGSVTNVETVIGASGAETLTIIAALSSASLDFAAGSDTITLANAANVATLTNIETITGNAGADTITLSGTITGTSIDLAAGSDTLALGAGPATVTTANVETMTGGAGVDTVTLSAGVTNTSVDLGAASDRLTLAAAGSTTTISNVETLTGGAGVDTITLGAAASAITIDLAAGNDVLTLANATNSLTVSNVETITGGSGADTLRLGSALTNSTTVDLSGGNDILTLAAGGNTGSVTNVETLTGGSGADTLTIVAALTSASIDTAAGADTITLANAVNSVSITNAETITGAAGADTVTLSGTVNGSSIDLAGGNDTLNLGAGPVTASVQNVETIVGGTGIDTITLSAAATNISVDLGAGLDSLTMAAAGNTFTLTNVETLIGGAGVDTMTIGGAATSASVDLAAGNDVLTLANATNSMSVANVETLTGGTGADTITLGSALTNSTTVDLGASTDALTLAAGGNTGSVTNVETTTGGSGADTLTIIAALSSASLDLAGGNDTVTLANASNTATVTNIETITGNAGVDTLTLSGTITATSIDTAAANDTVNMIRQDRIDILVDLAGHTAGNRLLAFARRPAALQIEVMLGHGYTSGLSAMDAFLADDALAPPGSDHLFSERVVRLPRIPLAFLPPAGMPEVAPAPATRNGFLTFGYFGRTVRLNDQVIATWARILHAIPTARLMLNNGPFAEPEGRTRMQARFAAHDIPPERLFLTCTAPQPATWAAYGEIDIALDPFPHNAGTTTIEALWQGVPVITLAGRPTVGRFGAAILNAVGLSDWVAADTDAYVARAVQAAADPDALAALRADLRPRFAASPLHDAPGLARAIEAAYRALWDEWREGDAPRLRRLFISGDVAGAVMLADRLLARDPAHADALHIKGLAAFRSGDAAHAADLLGRAPPRADILTDRGVILRTLRRPSEAEASYAQALSLNPDFAPALGNLANMKLDRGESAAAEALFTRALAQTPDQPWLLRGKALALLAREEPVEAETLLRHALAVAPTDAEAHETLGALLCQTGRPIEAEQHHRAALPTLRERHRGLGNLAVSLQTQGRHAEAETCYREALAAKPDYPSGHGNLLFALNYRHDISAETIFAEYRNWNERHARPITPLPPTRPSSGKLRIGYVSPDFRQHAVAHFALPLLAAHDRSAFELFCYAEVAVPDAVTARFQALVDHWRPTVGMTDAAVAAMIRADGIDVLVDMAGHTGGNRLLAFAHRPAPVQIESLLGLGTTTGMTAMDAFLADDILAPPGTEAVFSERLIRLPRIPLVYDPPAGMPEGSPLPALTNGHITFGYFGRVQRLNERVLSVWAQILHAVPGSRLVLNNQPFEEEAFRALYRARFAALGIDPDRLSLVHTRPQPVTWAAYGGIDIALDPFPHNAGTTTIEALWLGVPVVTRADRPTVGRFGAAILHTIGLDDWITPTDEAYITRATQAANNPNALATLRTTLRDHITASPLRDAPSLARAIEATYRALARTPVALAAE